MDAFLQLCRGTNMNLKNMLGRLIWNRLGSELIDVRVSSTRKGLRIDDCLYRVPVGL